jgi:hypothetical protein
VEEKNEHYKNVFEEIITYRIIITYLKQKYSNSWNAIIKKTIIDKHYIIFAWKKVMILWEQWILSINLDLNNAVVKSKPIH